MRTNSSVHVRLSTTFTSPLRKLLLLFFNVFLNVFALSEINVCAYSFASASYQIYAFYFVSNSLK